jgi:alanyl-tRNA synthetase
VIITSCGAKHVTSACNDCMRSRWSVLCARVQDARQDVDMTADAVLAEIADDVGRTEFVGYDRTHLDSSKVLGIVVGGHRVDEVEEGTTASVVLARTPFYAESGGQIGDRGSMVVRVTLLVVL